MRVIVCGGRDYADAAHINRTLDAIHGETPITVLIHGDASGADRLAGEWGQRAFPAVHVAAIPANWKEHGRAAGPLRNRKMLRFAPDLVVAFPGGRGTADMVKQAHVAGVKVQVVAP
jgi:hypothetical protein